MFRYVRDKYCKKPSTYRYCVGFVVKLSSYNLSDSIAESGVVTRDIKYHMMRCNVLELDICLIY